MAVEINGVGYEVDFHPNTAASSPLTSISSSSDDVLVGDVNKTAKKKNSRSGFSLPSKLKKKLKSRTNKKIKGKSKMASLKAAALEPSKQIIQRWKASNNSKYQDLQSSGSLFAGRLEEDDEITNLPTLHESREVKETPSFRSKRTETEGVIQEKKPKKRFKRISRLLKKLKLKRSRSSQGSVADTASTTSAPRNENNNDPPGHVDDTEVALASEDQTFFSLPSETLSTPTISISTSLHASNESKAALPPSLTLVRPSSSVARQARAANFIFNGSMMMMPVVEYPSDEEDSFSQVYSSSSSVIVSPVPCSQTAKNATTTTVEGSPRKKILNYKKNKMTKKNKTTTTKAHVVIAAPTSSQTAATTTVVASSSFSWNVWALLLVTVMGVLSVWQAWFALPQLVEPSKSVACLATSGANISFSFLDGVGVEQQQQYCYTTTMMEDSNNSDNVEWPYDEYEAPVVVSSIFDESGVLDCSYPPLVCLSELNGFLD